MGLRHCFSGEWKRRGYIAEAGVTHLLCNLSWKLALCAKQSLRVAWVSGKKRRPLSKGVKMKAEFTAIIEKAPDGGYWAICPELQGAMAQGEQ